MRQCAWTQKFRRFSCWQAPGPGSPSTAASQANCPDARPARPHRFITCTHSSSNLSRFKALFCISVSAQQAQKVWTRCRLTFDNGRNNVTVNTSLSFAGPIPATRQSRSAVSTFQDRLFRPTFTLSHRKLFPVFSTIGAHTEKKEKEWRMTSLQRSPARCKPYSRFQSLLPFLIPLAVDTLHCTWDTQSSRALNSFPYLIPAVCPHCCRVVVGKNRSRLCFQKEKKK